MRVRRERMQYKRGSTINEGSSFSKCKLLSKPFRENESYVKTPFHKTQVSRIPLQSAPILETFLSFITPYIATITFIVISVSWTNQLFYFISFKWMKFQHIYYK